MNNYKTITFIIFSLLILLSSCLENQEDSPSIIGNWIGNKYKSIHISSPEFSNETTYDTVTYPDDFPDSGYSYHTQF